MTRHQWDVSPAREPEMIAEYSYIEVVRAIGLDGELWVLKARPAYATLKQLETKEVIPFEIKIWKGVKCIIHTRVPGVEEAKEIFWLTFHAENPQEDPVYQFKTPRVSGIQHSSEFRRPVSELLVEIGAYTVVVLGVIASAFGVGQLIKSFL